ncbi:hypothetical protein IQ265_28365 [Nodosilinea sp. LEGE 06152]|uniref:hypothetical protein n=1 Tax=Nodosilinea sp. LEGE 06152 TaxID=2777966 RepID=UPI00187FF9A1|nr:hypothetical protein [Nodosilinea sp. LEGE 06152]MBE9160707.1 hypothetical protein [Nodosilinea sp. LEGE 06152]
MAALSRPRRPSGRSSNRREFSKYDARRLRARWFERIMAIVALLNLALVIGDLSYIPLRDLYLRFLPQLTIWYGETFKGIEPHRFTANYLETVDQLEEQVAQTGLTSAPAQSILTDLQQQSAAMIAENPFQIANRSGNLEQIKNKVRDRIGLESATTSFTEFWSVDHLSEAGFSSEMAFFRGEVQPLIETNFFRRIAVHGGFVDLFWRIDVWFNLLFGLELLARSIYLDRRYKNFTWQDAILWRWYDVLLIIPFSALRLPWLALLRIVPVTIRVNQSNLINLEPFQSRISRFVISHVAVEMTEIVVLRIIDQLQSLVRDGSVTQALLEPQSRRYIEVGGVDELEVLSKRLAALMVYNVLPQVKPEIDALLKHTVTQAFDHTPGYQGFRLLPGIGDLPDQVAQRVVAQLSANLYGVLKGTLENQSGGKLTQELVQKLVATFRLQLKENEDVEELEALVVNFLEEFKLNYVKQLAAADVDRLIEERYQIYNVTQSSSEGKS